MEDVAICDFHTHFSARMLTAVFTGVRTESLQLKYPGVFVDYTVNLNVIRHCGSEFFAHAVQVVYK